MISSRSLIGQPSFTTKLSTPPLCGSGGDGGGERFKKMLKSFLAVVLLSTLVERFFVSRMRDFLDIFVVFIQSYYN